MSDSILGLEGKVVVVTGSSQGVGLGCARQFARVGCDVVLVGRRADPLKAAAEELRELGGEVLTVTADVTRQSDVDAMVAASLDLETFDRAIAVNLPDRRSPESDIAPLRRPCALLCVGRSRRTF